jgi:hypothetical protein
MKLDEEANKHATLAGKTDNRDYSDADIIRK